MTGFGSTMSDADTAARKPMSPAAVSGIPVGVVA